MVPVSPLAVLEEIALVSPLAALEEMVLVSLLAALEEMAPSILAHLDHCGFSMSRWEDRSSGCSHWQSWECSLWLGNDAHASKANGNSNLWSYGVCGF